MILKIDRKLNAGRTFYVGRFPDGTTYQDLKKVFGWPKKYKNAGVKVQWKGTIDGEIFTICDVKQYGLITENTEWYITAANEVVGDLVLDYFEETIEKLKIKKVA
ncbi:MAG: hypothetical protein GY830_07820 [Bacteroidetes bacterium]|nr:hypothetical protein [Bacteroidota bacterium]